jgi:phage shock protein A
MALITRLSRLFHADINAVLDQIEEPELLLKQAIREMAENLEQQQNNKQQQEITQTVSGLDQQISLCFDNNQETLTKKLIRRKLESQYCLSQLTKNGLSLEQRCTELKVLLEQDQDQLNSMQQKAAIFHSHATNSTADSTPNMHSFSVHEEDVDVAFLDEKQKWSQS